LSSSEVPVLRFHVTNEKAKRVVFILSFIVRQLGPAKSSHTDTPDPILFAPHEEKQQHRDTDWNQNDDYDRKCNEAEECSFALDPKVVLMKPRVANLPAYRDSATSPAHFYKGMETKVNFVRLTLWDAKQRRSDGRIQ
jgi:hypothetical protein